MILYHYTSPQNRLLISWTGLKPGTLDEDHRDDHMTLGKPVVWLTRQNPAALTQADVDFFGARPELAKAFSDCGAECKLGSPFWPDRTEQIEIEIARHDKRLISYPDFLRKFGGREMVRFYGANLSPSAFANWWVYRGTIPPHKLPPITVAQARAGLQIQIDITKAKGEPPVHQDLLDAMRDADPDRLVDWHLDEVAA